LVTLYPLDFSASCQVCLVSYRRCTPGTVSHSCNDQT
jgi:hypothetical protein